MLVPSAVLGLPQGQLLLFSPGLIKCFLQPPTQPHVLDLDLAHFLTLKEPMDCTIQTQGREIKIKALLKTNGNNGKVS